jgi:phosphoglycerol transferase MdoB-like AlkP superfamily enzyme
VYLGRAPSLCYDAPDMLPDIHNEVVRRVLYLVAVLVANVVASGISWRLAGVKRRGIRLMGRVFAAFFGLANLGLVVGCLLHLLRGRVDWFYAALLVTGFIFAYRIGGATIGRYP